MAGRLRIALDLLQAQREGAAGLERRRDERFRALVEHARSHSPFYSHHYRGLQAGCPLRDLPPVDKRTLMGAFDAWVTDPRVTLAGIEAFMSDAARVGTLYQGEYFVCTSAGTTGHPGVFVYDRDAVETYRAITSARINPGWIGAGSMLGIARRGFRWAAVLGTGGHYVGAGWMELERRRSAWRSRAFRVFSVQQSLPELVCALNTFDPVILTAYPSALELLAQEQAAGRLCLRPAMIEMGGESTTPEGMARAAAAFGCPVHNLYSASECPTIAFSCAHGWMHVNSDWVLLEPVGEDMRPTPSGVASDTVLLTNLANRVQPLIRYDLGDAIRVRPDPCPCGSVLPAIQVVGRRDDVLRFVTREGRTVVILPLAISSIVDGVPGVHRSQLVQTGPTSLRVRLQVKPGCDQGTVWRDVATALQSYLQTQGLARVDLVLGSEPPLQAARLGKFRQVIGMPSASVGSP